MCTCSFCAYIAYFDSGCRCSQQHSAPTRPSAVSCTARSLPSPSPNTVRSTCVGLSLRRCEIVRPSASMIHWPMYRLPPCFSLRPIATTMPYSLAACAMRSAWGVP